MQPGDRVKLKSGGPTMTIGRTFDKPIYKSHGVFWDVIEDRVPFARCYYCRGSDTLDWDDVPIITLVAA